jgi:hypothetical protein
MSPDIGALKQRSALFFGPFLPTPLKYHHKTSQLKSGFRGDRQGEVPHHALPFAFSQPAGCGPQKCDEGVKSAA